MRTIYWFISFWVIQLILFTRSIHYISLGKKGKIEEQKEYLHQLTTNWARKMIKNTGSTVEVLGASHVPDENVLFVSNHQGNFDIPLLMGFVPKAKGFIAKKELSKIPFVSIWMRRMGCTFLDRENLRGSIKMIKLAIKQLENGETLVVFPEGTRSQGPHMNPFKKGSLSLAIKSGVPIVPLTINGTYKLLEEKKRIRKDHIVLTIHEPIYTKDLSNDEQKELSGKVYAIINSGLL